MRRRPRPASLAGVLLLVALPLAAFAERGSGAEHQMAAVSRGSDSTGLLDQLYRETGAAREPPEPGWTEYGRHVGVRLVRWIGIHLEPLDLPVGVMARALGYGILALSLVTLAVLLWRLLAGLRWGNQSDGRASPALAPMPEEGLLREEPWRARIDEHLAGGSVQAALEAVWWWLAVSTTSREVDASWTSRELLAAAGRRDLSPLARELDRMAYGPERPSRNDVRQLVRSLEARLP